MIWHFIHCSRNRAKTQDQGRRGGFAVESILCYLTALWICHCLQSLIPMAKVWSVSPWLSAFKSKYSALLNSHCIISPKNSGSHGSAKRMWCGVSFHSLSKVSLSSFHAVLNIVLYSAVIFWRFTIFMYLCFVLSGQLNKLCFLVHSPPQIKLHVNFIS